MNPKSPDIMAKFNEFYENSLNEFADFQLVKNPDEKLSDILGNKAKIKEFKVIGQDGTGSIIAFWKYAEEIDFLHSPIVWLSSEGFPNSVFTSTFEEFMSILPYGTGFVYDVLCNYYFHKQSPMLQPSPKQKFTKSKIKSYLNENKKQYKGLNEFIVWLNNEMEIEVAEKPLSIIENAILNHIDLANWLEK